MMQHLCQKWPWSMKIQLFFTHCLFEERLNETEFFSTISTSEINFSKMASWIKEAHILSGQEKTELSETDI